MNDMDAEWISEAVHEFGYTECKAISIELDEEPVCYKINMSQEGLLKFDSEFSLSNFLIVPLKPEFAILKESGYYFLIAGPKNFVRKAVGCSFPTARTMFLDRYANDEFKFWPEKNRHFLISIAKRYEQFNG